MNTSETSISNQTLAYFKRTGSPIVAAATAMGGPVAILRISGANLSSLEPLIGKLPAPGCHEYRSFRESPAHDAAIIDRGLVLYFKTPQSFTGEDVVELQVHGVASVIEKLTNEIKKYGVVHALPGEFTFRAVMNSKMSLAEAEALHGSLSISGLGQSWASKLLTVRANSERQVAQRLENAITSLEEARGRIEAAIDFSEADQEQARDIESALTRVAEAKSRLADLISAFENFSRANGEIRTAIIGEPNVGKSTLLNRLLGAEKALVSPMAGTTRDVVEGRVRLDDGRWIVLLDTAGMRQLATADLQSHDAVEKKGIDLGIETARNADVLVWVKRVGENKKYLEDIFPGLGLGKRVVEVYSFADTQSESAAQSLAGTFDLRDSKNRVEKFLKNRISEELGAGDTSGVPESVNELVVSQRQYQHIRAAWDSLEEARRCLVGELPLEIAGDQLHQAEAELKLALGRQLGEGYIEAIFRQFCLGK